MQKIKEARKLSPRGLSGKLQMLSVQNKRLIQKIAFLEDRCHTLNSLLENAEPEILRESRQRLHTIIDQAPALIAYVDREERYICCNAEYEQWFGVSPKTIRGKKVNAVVGKDIYLQLADSIQNALTGKCQDLEVQYFFEENRGRVIRSRLVPQFDNDGIVNGYVELSTDISAQKHLQNHLEAQTKELERVKRILDESSDIITMAYPDGRIIYSNKIANTFLQFPHSSSAEKKTAQIIQPTWAKKLIDEEGVPIAVRDGSWLGETAIINDNDCEIPVSQMLIAHKNANGKIECFSTVIRDISARVDHEKQLKNAMRQISFYNRDLEQLAYSCSHDLAEPLRTISGYLQLLQKRYGSRLDDKANMLISEAIKGTLRLDGLLADLLQYTRITNKNDCFVSVNMNDVVEKVLGNLRRTIYEKKAEITCLGLPRVKANESQMIILFQNLIGNSLKFCQNGSPHIEVCAHKKDQTWVFAVSDNGIGIDPKFKNRIFKVFQRLHRRDAYQGSGIGLSICKKIVSHHGGSIWLESEPGKGSTFFFSIPA